MSPAEISPPNSVSAQKRPSKMTRRKAAPPEIDPAPTTPDEEAPAHRAGTSFCAKKHAVLALSYIENVSVNKPGRAKTNSRSTLFRYTVWQITPFFRPRSRKEKIRK